MMCTLSIVLRITVFVLLVMGSANATAQYQVSSGAEYRELMSLPSDSLLSDYRIVQMITSSCPSMHWQDVDSNYACRRNHALENDMISERSCAILILASSLDIRDSMQIQTLDYRWLNRDLLLQRYTGFATEVLNAPIEITECNRLDGATYTHRGYLDYWVRQNLLKCLSELSTTADNSRQSVMDRLRLILSLCVYEELAGIECK